MMLLLALTVPGHAGETYISQEVLWAPWGDDVGQFGLIEEAEGVGPQSLCLDPQSNIYILDLVNRRVQVFTPQGELLRQMVFEILAHDLCLNQQGDLYLLAPYHGLVEKLDPEGHSLARWSLASQIRLIDGIRAAGDQVVLRTARQVEHAIADAKGPLDPEEQLAQMQMGMGSLDPTARYRTQWISDHMGLLQFLDAQGGKLRSVWLTTQEMLGSLVFLGADRENNVYLRAEIFGPRGEVRQKVFKYSHDGNLAAEFELPSDGFTCIYRNLRVHQNGDLYQLLAEPLGVRVLRWTVAPESEEGWR